MNISFEDAFNSVKKDNFWIRKTLIIGVLSILMNVIFKYALKFNIILEIVSILIGITISFYIVSFYYKTLNNYLYSKNELSELSINNKFFLLGIKGSIVDYMYTFIQIAIIFGELYFFKIFSVTKVVSLIILGITMIIFLSYGYMFRWISKILYARKYELKKAFNFKIIFEVIKFNHKECWSLYWEQLLLGLLTAIGFVCSIITIIGIPIVLSYSSYCEANLIAQFGKSIDILKTTEYKI